MTFSGYLEGYGVLASKGISTTIALADIGRCIYSTQQARELTDEAGIDIGDDFAQVLFWYKYLAIGNLKQDKRFMDPQGAIAQVCYAIVYASLSVVTSLEFLNGSGAPDTGSEFTADSNQSTFTSIHDNELARTEAGTSCGTWSSVAAEWYTEANQALQGFTREIAAADAATATIVQRQGDQIQEAREMLINTKLALIGLLFLIAFLMGPLAQLAQYRCQPQMDEFGMLDDAWKKPYFWNECVIPAAQTIEPYLPFLVLPPCIAATGVVSWYFDRLIHAGNTNANELQEQATAYQNVAKEATNMRAGAPGQTERRHTAPGPTPPGVASVQLALGALDTTKAAGKPAAPTPITAGVFQPVRPATQHPGRVPQPVDPPNQTPRRTGPAAEDTAPAEDADGAQGAQVEAGPAPTVSVVVEKSAKSVS